MTAEPPLTRTELLRRVVIVCCSFTRNLAFYRTSLSVEGVPLLSPRHPQGSFWRQAHSNFFDMLILEWFKLFGDARGRHNWFRVVSDPASFEADLLRHVGMTAAAFQNHVAELLKFRDKFVARLDSQRRMYVPQIDTGQESIRFYYRHVVTQEATKAGLAGLPSTVDELTAGYEDSCREAAAVYAAALQHA